MSAKPRHGHALAGAPTRVYNVWRGIRQRCTNPKATGFSDYGGRGIRVCDEWDTFIGFVEWANANGYADHLSIERQDVDGDYCPANCYWADNTIQACNKRKRPKTNNNFIGVYPMRSKWQARVTYQGKTTVVGVFRTEQEAACARDTYVINEKLPHKLNF